MQVNHIQYIATNEACLPPIRQGWEILPDQQAIVRIATEIINSLRTQIQRSGAGKTKSDMELQQIISDLPNEKIYEALVAVRGKSLPRFNCGNIPDIAVPLREELLKCLKS